MFNKGLILAIALLLGGIAQADDHSPGEGLSTISMQVNACYLKEGSTFRDLEKLDRRFHAWTRENNVERTVVRHTPLMYSGRPERPMYVDYHLGPHATAGKAWKLFQTTPEGQAMNEEWQRIADCRVLINRMHRKYIGGEIEVGQQRVVEFNWCTKHDDKTWRQMAERHTVRAGQIPGGGHAHFWGVMMPQVGGRDMPGDFAHVLSYPDMEAFMAKQAWFDLEGGNARYLDYTSSYASCTGPNLFTEKVLYVTNIP